MKEVPIIGVDLAKQVVQLHGATAVEEVVFRKKLSRKQFLAFMQAHRECQFAIEACTTANHLARTLADLGHEVRLIAPKFIKPYLKNQRNDRGGRRPKAAHQRAQAPHRHRYFRFLVGLAVHGADIQDYDEHRNYENLSPQPTCAASCLC